MPNYRHLTDDQAEEIQDALKECAQAKARFLWSNNPYRANACSHWLFAMESAQDLLDELDE